ncbi:MAG TPA: type II secretion system protein GspL [Paraburkholderia sp.]|nr:type II secretion system protein GspL [Paraburkholderia sp.]
MSTLIVLLPPRDPAVSSQEWQLPEMPFVLLDKTGHTMRTGHAALSLLPRATATVLMVAARDLLMMAAAVPALKGPKLRQALPNVVEDHLIQDPQTCHIAIDPKPLEDGRRLLAVVDRGWFRFIYEAFSSAGHRNLRAVPVTSCLPLPEMPVDALAEVASAAAAEVEGDAQADGLSGAAGVAAPVPLVAAVLGEVANALVGLPGGEATPDVLPPRLEVAIARGRIGEGLAVPMAAVTGTVTALAGEAPVTLYALTGLPGNEPQIGAKTGMSIPGALPLTFDELAQRSLKAGFDLCQFEFVSQPWRLDRATLRRLRVPIALLGAAAVIAIIGVNTQWLMLTRQRDAISTQMTEMLLNAFPKTTVVLDAPGQMTRQLAQLRVAAGELSPDDFLTLADGLARSLGPVPVNGIAAIDYQNRHLEVTFKPAVKVDPDLAQRLARNGLNGAIDSNTGKWTIRSGQ